MELILINVKSDFFLWVRTLSSWKSQIKRAQERKNATNNDSSENEPEIPKDSLKSKSQIMNSDPINGREQVKRKKKKKKGSK